MFSLAGGEVLGENWKLSNISVQQGILVTEKHQEHFDNEKLISFEVIYIKKLS